MADQPTHPCTPGWRRPRPLQEEEKATDLDDKLDAALLASPWLAGVLYLLGASVIHTKVPIYILLSFEYAVLTYRFYKVCARHARSRGIGRSGRAPTPSMQEPPLAAHSTSR